MKLLREDTPEGFPTDYLQARIKARRTTLISDWDALLLEGTSPGLSDERIWGDLLKEYEWIFRQMNQRLKQIFAPLFVLFELKTIVLCLRYKEVGETVKLKKLLTFSLLAEKIREALHKDTEVPATIAALTDCFKDISTRFQVIETAFSETGLKGFENELMRAYLEQTLQEKLHPAIRDFFLSFIDLRNLMLIYKHLRWSLSNTPQFISGGRINPSRLNEITEQGNSARLDQLVTDRFGLKVSVTARSEGVLETSLLRIITTNLHKSGRTDKDVAMILDYLWRLYVEARNLAVLHHGKSLNVEALTTELIR